MKSIFSLFILISLSGCKVGPDYQPPLTIMPTSYTEDRVDQTVELNDKDFFQWWAIFNDPFLDSLLEQTINGNFDFRIAVEQIYQARSQYWIQVTQLLPEFAGDFQGSHYTTSSTFRQMQSMSSSQACSIRTPLFQNFFQAGFDAIWQIDLFGKIRRSAEAALDIWEAKDEDARAVKITVLSDVASRYVLITALQKKVDIAAQLVKLDEEILDNTSVRFEAGLLSLPDVETARALLELDRANQISAETLLKVNIYALAVLLGKHPESVIEDFHVIRPIPYAYGRVPAGLPADLLRRRPDIISAERNLAAATEQIGVAVADLFPQLSLTGSSSSFASNPLQGANIGWASDKINKLFDPCSRIAGIGGLVTFPIFDFGKRCSAVDVQYSLKEQAYLYYQKIVITALQEVEQALVSYFNDEKKVRILTREVTAYEKTVELTLDLFNAGLSDFSQVLRTRNTWLLSQNSLVDSQQALATDLISVYKALGGDW